MNQLHHFHIPLNRRRLLRSLLLTTAGLWVPGAMAEALTLTPRTTAGPYYPDHLPLDQDNDLIRVTDDLTPAVGIITNVGGRVLDKSGTPIKGALVELWQADSLGSYIHSRGVQNGQRDAHFQGYGKFETATDGGWRFRTIKPGLYTGRTRHFHFGVTLPGQSRRFTTQLMFAGEPGNANDMVLNEIRDAAQRASIVREFKEDADSKQLATTWDIVMGLTPADDHDDHDDHPPRPPGSRPGPDGRPMGDRPLPPNGPRPEGRPPEPPTRA